MAMMTSVIFDTARKSRNEGLALGAAHFYLARKAGWTERGAGLNVNINGLWPNQLDGKDDSASRFRLVASRTR